MDLDEMGRKLDMSLGNSGAFEDMLQRLKKMADQDFYHVVKHVLRTPYSSRAQAMDRLVKLHKSTATFRMKQGLNKGRSAF